MVDGFRKRQGVGRGGALVEQRRLHEAQDAMRLAIPVVEPQCGAAFGYRFLDAALARKQRSQVRPEVRRGRSQGNRTAIGRFGRSRLATILLRARFDEEKVDLARPLGRRHRRRRALRREGDKEQVRQAWP